MYTSVKHENPQMHEGGNLMIIIQLMRVNKEGTRSTLLGWVDQRCILRKAPGY